MRAPPAALRLAEPLAALSLASDLARGHPQEEALRATSVAMHIAHALQLDSAQCEAVYYATLLRYVGCTATSPEYVATYGASDIIVRRRGDYVDVASPRDAMRFIYSLTDERSGPRRIGRFLSSLRAARAAGIDAARADCEVGAALLRQFGLPDAVQEAVLHSFERWDGKGWPDGLRGDAVPLATRIASAAFTATMFAAIDVDVARETIDTRAGSALDPGVARAAGRCTSPHRRCTRTRSTSTTRSAAARAPRWRCSPWSTGCFVERLLRACARGILARWQRRASIRTSRSCSAGRIDGRWEPISTSGRTRTSRGGLTPSASASRSG